MTASPLIFHRNVAWYCCEYHERNTINLSLFIQQMIQNSRPLFQAFQPCDFTNMLNICAFHHSSACYAYLPSPAFLTARESLLRDILAENGVSEQDIQQYLTLNAVFRADISHSRSEQPAPQKPFIYLFQLEEMRRSWSSDGTLIEQKLYFVQLYCSSFFFAKACRIQSRTAPHLLDKHDTILVLQNGVLFNI